MDDFGRRTIFSGSRGEGSDNLEVMLKLIPIVLIMIIGFTLFLHFSGVLNITQMFNYYFGNYGFDQNNFDFGAKCFNSSSEMQAPCCTMYDGVKVSTVLALNPQCACPLDTVDYNQNFVFENKNYKVCECKCE